MRIMLSDDQTLPSQEAREALEYLPARPLLADASDALVTASFSQWEVVVAYNLDPPYRYTQEFFWLEVLAIDEKEAVRTASEWIQQAPENFESTDLVRRSSVHEKALGTDQHNQPLKIAWNLPIEEGLPPAAVVRHPITGIRVGFVAQPEAESRWLAAEGQGRYRLLTRKPVKEADPVCLAPLVKVA